jgi:hypothetical protein
LHIPKQSVDSARTVAESQQERFIAQEFACYQRCPHSAIQNRLPDEPKVKRGVAKLALDDCGPVSG